jgi:hypothetical protein
MIESFESEMQFGTRIQMSPLERSEKAHPGARHWVYLSFVQRLITKIPFHYLLELRLCRSIHVSTVLVMYQPLSAIRSSTIIAGHSQRHNFVFSVVGFP